MDSQLAPRFHHNRLPIDSLVPDPDDHWSLSSRTLDVFTKMCEPGKFQRDPWPFLATYRFLEEANPDRRTYLLFESLDGREIILRFVCSVPEGGSRQAIASCTVWNDENSKFKAIPCRGLRGAAFGCSDADPDHVYLEHRMEFTGEPPFLTLTALRPLISSIVRMGEKFDKYLTE